MDNGFSVLLWLDFEEIKIMKNSVTELKDNRNTKILTLKIQGIKK